MTGLGRSGVASFLLVVCLLSVPALAVQPDEILKDPALEARARTISAGLRCLVCQNQSIDDSDATVARDLRILIREQLMKNQTDEQVVSFVVERYGDYVLLKPRLTAKTVILWFTPFLVVLLGGFYLLRGRKTEAPVHDQLSDAEKAELDAILRK
ncbi:MAG: cytochrome c-type biogenesis protein CcmH [Phyllobacteriaceae bacterium]|nr:cytochrome c-type biogenesis protein CcmH [Phyllobacteriaceae bacterium]